MGACFSIDKREREKKWSSLRNEDDEKSVLEYLPDIKNELYPEPSPICEVPMEMQELILMRAFVMLYVRHYRTAIIYAGWRTFSTLARVSFHWWQTLKGWPQSDTRLWLKHQIVKRVAVLQWPNPARPLQLASINTHCRVRGVAQLSDRIYVVCAGYYTIQVFSACDCSPVGLLVVEDMDDPRDMDVCATTRRLYVADHRCVWTVRTDNGWTRKHVDDIHPVALSVTDSRLLVTCRPSHHLLLLYAADGSLLRRVVLSASMDVWHAIESPSNSTLVVCHLSPDPGVSMVGLDGRVIKSGTCYPEDQFLHPCHVVAVDGGRFVVADGASVVLFDPQLDLDRVLLGPDHPHDVEEDRGDVDRFTMPIRLSYSPRTRRLIVACRSQFVNVYAWRPSLTSTSDSWRTVSETSEFA